MTYRQLSRRLPARRALRLLGVLALAQATMASDCAGPEAVSEQSAIAEIVPATRADTTYATDTLIYRGPTVTGTNGVPLTDFDVRWETSRAAVARLLDPPVQRYAGGTASLTDTMARPVMRVEVMRDGDAIVTMTPIGVSFVNDRVQRYAASIVALANRPTILDLQSAYTLRVGDTLTLAASPRGSAGGVITTGSVDWNVANAGVAQLYPATVRDWSTSATARNPIASGPTERVGLRAVTPGQTPLRVTYTGRGGVRLERTVTVNVTANAARVAITRDANSTYFANDAIAVFARLLDAAGQPVDPSALRFATRDPGAVTVRPGTTGCPSAGSPSECAAVVEPNDAEIIRRGGVVRVWVVATAGAAAADSVQLTIYPAVASLEITPPAATLALGGAVDLTVVARDAQRNAIPAAAFRVPPVIRATRSDASSALLQLSTQGKPPMVTNVVARALPPGGTGTVEVGTTAGIGGTILEARATITIRAVDRIVVTPANATTRVGGEAVRFTAQLLDGAGRPVTENVRVDWSIADSSIATLGTPADGGALAVGRRVGRTEVVASAQGVTGRAALEVTAAPVPPTIAVTPTTLQLQVGQTAAVSAVVANGTPPVAVTWVTRDPAVAAITPDGGTATVRAAAVGETYVVASYTSAAATVRDSTRVRVTAAPPASRARLLLLEPRSAEITAPASVGYRVSLFDANGARIAVEPGATVRYASSSPAIATVDPTTGRATGVAGGTTTIRARYLLDGQELLSDTAALLVYPPTAGHLGSVEISTGGDARELRVGQELLFQVLVRDANGNPVASNVPGLAVGPTSSPYVDVVPAPELTHGLFYRIRGKAPTPAPVAGDPLAAVVLIRADVTGAGASLPIVVRP